MVTTNSREIFRAQHSPTVTIRVVYREDERDGSKGFDVYVNEKRWERFYSPGDVTTWFQNTSLISRAKWQMAYWQCGLKPSDFKRPAPLDVDLAVPYYSQRDNERFPGGTCNVTAFAEVFAYYKVPRQTVNGRTWTQREDELSAFLEAHGKDRHSHDDLEWMARQYGLEGHFGTDRTWDEIRAQIRAGHPVIVSGLFTSAGHIITIRGVRGPDFVVNDSWGNALTRYRDHNGENLIYPYAYMDRVVRGGHDAKWAHFLQRRDGGAA